MRVPTTSPAPSAADPTNQPETDSPLYAVGDVHGELDPLRSELITAGLLDDDGHWCGRRARLWFLGDLTDRGPDGIGVVELIRRLHDEAAEAGGMVDTLLGNHEVLLLGSRRFGDELIDLPAGARSFRSTWQLNGGHDSDLDAMSDEQADWLASRLPLLRVGDHLLSHSDTLAYLEYGDSVEAINEAIGQELAAGAAPRWWDVFRQLTRRHDFRGPDGPQRAEQLLDALGGTVLVHGHSPIPEHLATDPSQVSEPLVYAEGRVVSIDGGLFAGGPCLVTRLPVPGTRLER